MKTEGCSACQKRIVFAMLGGRVVAVEPCMNGRGDIALTEDLLERRAPLADKVANRTAWRLHMPQCKGLRSFTKPFRREAIR